MKFLPELASSLLLLSVVTPSTFPPTTPENDLSETENFGGYCDSKPSCSCIKGRKKSTVHCTDVVDIMSELKTFFPMYKTETGDGIRTEVLMRCNPNATEDPFENLSLLELDPDKENKIIFKTINCPLPPRPYTSLFLSKNTHVKAVSITSLVIDCGPVTNFSITADHLAGLRDLSVLSIQCHALKILPHDLLREVSKEITQIFISDTNIESIPDNFFPNLTKLGILSFNDNKLTHISQNTFLGVGDNLYQLNLHDNYIRRWDDELLLNLQSVTALDISSNLFSAFPSNLGKLSRLTSLRALNNKFTLTDAGDFIGPESLRFLYFGNNRLKQLHSRMFSSIPIIVSIGLSNNSIGESFSDTTPADFPSGNITLSTSTPEIPKEVSSSLPEDLFSRNVFITRLELDHNALISLPEKIFLFNTNLSSLNVSSNRLTNLPSGLFETNTELKVLDLSNNFITELSETFFRTQRKLQKLNLSKNKIKYLGQDFFRNLETIEKIYLNHNLIQILPYDIFIDFEQRPLILLNLHDNALTSLPNLTLPYVTDLRLERNKIDSIGKNAFSKMKSLVNLDCSNNLIKEIQRHAFRIEPQSLRSINLANNMLTSVSVDWFVWSYSKENPSYLNMNFSGNLLDNIDQSQEFELTIFRTESLDLSRNNLTSFGKYNDYGRLLTQKDGFRVRHLDLSSNRIRTLDSARNYDFIRKTWGLTCGFEEFFLLEVLNLANNEIEEIPMDWRNSLPHLRLLDLSHNRIKYLWHQDLLFSTGNVLGLKTSPYAPVVLEREWASHEYPCTLKLTVDLRHNLIAGIELPESLLRKVPNECWKDSLFSHATLLLGHNPFVCDCQVYNVLSYAAKEIRPTAELERSKGSRLIRPAQIDLEGLACSEPISVRGKQLSDPETWMHHLIPLKGVCSLIQ